MNQGGKNSDLRLVLPSDGDLYQPCLEFLSSCGLPVERASGRAYSARVSSVDGITVLFQRTADIGRKVDEGSADLGITGLDKFSENDREGGNAIPILNDLGFGRCELVMAIPSSWVDIISINDLADLAAEFHQDGRQLRIASKYPRLLQKFLYAKGINYFTIVQSSGSLEAAPTAGYADIIADLTATGTTLRENGLRMIDDGTILASQACLIGNRVTLSRADVTMDLARNVLEMIEGQMRAKSYYRLTSNVYGKSFEEISSKILSTPDLSGLQGPTISKVYNNRSEDCYSVSLVIPKYNLIKAMDHLRNLGGSDVSASKLDYIFQSDCSGYQTLLASMRE